MKATGKTITVTIESRIAKAEKDALYICGNSDYAVEFLFDAEWDELPTKTARFVFGDKYTDVVFQGNVCPMPVISHSLVIQIGVFAGNLHTTTPAQISARKSILCDAGTPVAPTEDVYSQIMALLEEIKAIDYETIAAAVETALEEAKESGEFDGRDGYTPVKGLDYYTEEDKTEMVNMVLAALPTWTGGSY